MSELAPDQPIRISPRPPDPLAPSEYTGLLIQAIRMRSELVRGRDVLEIGFGSGVVLKALESLGAARVSGVDIEPDAVARAGAMLACPGEIVQGDMWAPWEGQRFDLVVANLPHFPAERLTLPGRHASWSSGGRDGRRFLDRFFAGLPDHLAAGGAALLTHNAFVNLDRSRQILAASGFGLWPLLSTLVPIAGEKRAGLSASTLAAFTGQSLHHFGDYLFGEVHVVEVRRSASAS